MANTVQILKFFISYSHEDLKYKEKLLESLKSLEVAYNIDVWHDGKILAGQNIDKEILKQLGQSNVVLLLITPSFLASYYCMEVELKESVARMEKGECVVVPVICKQSTLTPELPFYKLDRVPTDGKAICKFKPQSDGCTEATNMIKDMIDESFPRSKKQKNERFQRNKKQTNEKVDK